MYKYVFLSCLQFDCTNTLNDQVLEEASVHMESSEEYEVLKTIPCAKLEFNNPGTTYTILSLPEGGAG